MIPLCLSYTLRESLIIIMIYDEHGLPKLNYKNGGITNDVAL